MSSSSSSSPSLSSSLIRSYRPPVFGKLGKSVQDLLKKKFDFDSQIKSIRKANNGITIESGLVGGKGGAPRGFLKGRFVSRDFGEVEVEGSTDPNVPSKASLKLTQLHRFAAVYNGLTLTAAAVSKDKDSSFSGPVLSVEEEYYQSNVAVSSSLKTDTRTHKLEAAAAVGAEGFNVGGSAVFDVSRGFDRVDANLGFEYSTSPDLVFTVSTERRADVVNVSGFYRQSSRQVVGGQVKLDLYKLQPEVTLAGEYAIDAATSVKGKLELPSGHTTVAADTRLLNPQVQVGIAARFQPYSWASQKVAADKLGLQLTFGDY